MQLIPFKPCRAQTLGDLPSRQMKVAFQNQGMYVIRDSKRCQAKICPCFYQCKMRIFPWRCVYVRQYKCKTDHYLARQSIMLTSSFLLIPKKTKLKITKKNIVLFQLEVLKAPKHVRHFMIALRVFCVANRFLP